MTNFNDAQKKVALALIELDFIARESNSGTAVATIIGHSVAAHITASRRTTFKVDGKRIAYPALRSALIDKAMAE